MIIYKIEKNIDSIRTLIKPEFAHISEKEIKDTLKNFASIRNMLNRYDRGKQICFRTLYNRLIILTNVFKKEYVIKKLRYITSGECHAYLNSLFLHFGLIGLEDDIPYDVEFFKNLMGLNKCHF